MFSFFKSLTSALLAAFVLLLGACAPDEPANPLRFQESDLTLSSSHDTVTVQLTLERPAAENTPITLTMQSNRLVHGNQFTVEPASLEVNGTVFLALAKGAQTTSFQVVKLGTPPLEGDEQIRFTLASTQNGITIGTPASVIISVR
ncbi:hypothetical protein SAMN05421823_10570 [Catalinimonas alkaloidigena]|uniref:Calx-beta domain-containing protein n=1 Tax=Catalinimonas alkaloidigena TaxID=1075417 RepID=A0A1G9IQB9_9BACT|nr:hypothetical protein [Catalinimonas alkaloidigena]SDL27255.1 hypothetical protein SAMN05421823_10570 [Catalinimonas alkaloidigena]